MSNYTQIKGKREEEKKGNDIDRQIIYIYIERERERERDYHQTMVNC